MSEKEKTNLFSSYGIAAEKRAEEQKQTKAYVKGETAKKRGSNATTMTLSISQEDKQKVKAYAAAHSTTVSDLLHYWISQNCID